MQWRLTLVLTGAKNENSSNGSVVGLNDKLRIRDGRGMSEKSKPGSRTIAQKAHSTAIAATIEVSSHTLLKTSSTKHMI